MLNTTEDSSPRCVHCGYPKSGLEPGSSDCPECGHSLDAPFIPEMTTPPRWYRTHLAGGTSFRYAGATALLVIAVFALTVLGSMIALQITGSPSGWSARVTAGVRYGVTGLFGVALALNAVGGACCLAAVPAEPRQDRRRELLFALIPIAVALLALPAAYAIAFDLAVHPIAILAGMALSLVLISVDARLLPSRADAFVLFATDGREKTFLELGTNAIDGVALLVAAAATYAMVTGDHANVVLLFYILATLAWRRRRASAARAVRAQIAKAARDAGSATEPAPATAQ